MKKKLLTALVIIVLSFGAVGGGITAFADVSLEECDLCFKQTANALLDVDEVDGTSIVTKRRPLYDLNLNEMGYVYSFDTGYGEGYAIVICDNGVYVAQEFVKSATSPYAGVAEEDELCVYSHTMNYFKSVDGVICDIESSAPLSGTDLEELRKVAFFYQNDGGTTFEQRTVSVEFASRTYDGKSLCHSAPMYINVGWSGGCAAVAGGNLIGYYDRFYEDLIPNHTAGISNGSLFMYNFADDYVNDAISTLYADMNGDETGITEDGFKSGMKKYCSRKGRSIDFTSLKSGGKINYDSVKSCINGGNPLVLFLNTYTICSVYIQGGVSNTYYQIFSGNHVMPGFGYSDVVYYLNDGTKVENKFINVTTGWADPRTAYFNIDYCTNIVSAYKVNIY